MSDEEAEPKDVRQLTAPHPRQGAQVCETLAGHGWQMSTSTRNDRRKQMLMHELHNEMSPQMRKSFRIALEAALRDNRIKNYKLFSELEQIQREWNKTRAAEFEQIDALYYARLDITKRQIAQLYALESELGAERMKAREELANEGYRATAPEREALKEIGEEISKERKEIEAGIIAKYEAKLQAKAEKVGAN